jgi:hypothetical protein
MTFDKKIKKEIILTEGFGFMNLNALFCALFEKRIPIKY